MAFPDASQRGAIKSESSSSASRVPTEKIAGGMPRRSAYSGDTSGSFVSVPGGRKLFAKATMAGVLSTSFSSPQLRALGAQPIEHAFPDHHRHTVQDLAFGDGRRIVMTEKDAVKCAAFATDHMWYLEVAARLPEADAAQLLDAALTLLSPEGVARA